MMVMVSMETQGQIMEQYGNPRWYLYKKNTNRVYRLEKLANVQCILVWGVFVEH